MQGDYSLMASFVFSIDNQTMRDIERIYKDSDKIFGSMTKAGAETVRRKVRKNVPASFKKSRIMNHLKVTKTYRSPSDGGINNKVGFYGYFTNHRGRKTPAPLVAKVFEYGKTNFLKRPFFRKSFDRKEIYKVMMEQQRKASGGLLDE
jgi:hypothetical protein